MCLLVAMVVWMEMDGLGPQHGGRAVLGRREMARIIPTYRPVRIFFLVLARWIAKRPRMHPHRFWLRADRVCIQLSQLHCWHCVCRGAGEVGRGNFTFLQLFRG